MRRSSLGLLSSILGAVVGTGLALLAPGTFSPTYRAAIALHGIAGVALAAISVAALIEHVRARVTRPSLRWTSFVEGVSAALAWSGSCATGIALIAHALGLADFPVFRLHAIVSGAAIALALLHSARSLLSRRESTSGFVRAATVAAVVAVICLGVALGAGRRVTWTVIAGGPNAPFDESPAASPFERVGTEGCGANGCHPDVVAEHARSAHAVSYRSPHFAAIAALLHRERPDQAGFCSGCHFPATLGGAQPTSGYGIHCLTCHAADAASPGDPLGGAIHLIQPRGHLDVLDRASAEQRAGRTGLPRGWALTLVRAAAPAHRRAFSHLATPQANDLCLTCHGLYIPRPTAARFVPDRCADCHMRGQLALRVDGLATPTHQSRLRSAAPARHLFAGSNMTLFRSLGDDAMADATERWLRGELVFDPQVQFWNFGSYAAPAQRAAWFSLRVAPRADPVPGTDWPVDIATVNVGVGHPFPSTPLDLARVTLEGELTAADGTVLWQVPPDAYRLGGRVVTESGEPLTSHRLWIPHHNTAHQPIERGRTFELALTVRLPADEHRFPLRLAVRWVYSDLTGDVLVLARGADARPGAVVLASAEARVPYRSVLSEPRDAVGREPAGDRGS